MTDNSNIDVSPRELAFRAGHWLIPLRDGDSKRPAVSAWSTKRVQNLESIIKSKNIGLVTGENNIWALDVDSKNALDQRDFNDFVCRYIDQHFAYGEYLWQETVSGGLHFIFKLKDIQNESEWRNKSFAKNSDNEVLLESRGKGGYIKVYDDLVFRNLVGLSSVTEERVQKLIDWACSLNAETKIEVNKTSSHSIDSNLNSTTATKIVFASLESSGYTRWVRTQLGFRSKAR